MTEVKNTTETMRTMIETKDMGETMMKRKKTAFF